MNISPSHESPDTATKPASRLVRKVMMTAFVLLVGAAATLFYLIRSEPQHWQDYQAFIKATTDQEREQLVKNVESRLESFATEMFQSEQAATVEDLAKTLTSVEAGQDEQAAGSAEEAGGTGGEKVQLASTKLAKPAVKTIFLTADEVNAYVAQKFHDWINYRDYDMPPELSEPAVGIEEGRMLVSFEYSSNNFSQIFTAGFEIRFIGNGLAELKLTEVSAGKLSLPPEGIGDYLRNHAPDTTELKRAAKWLDKLDRVEFKPSMKLGHQYKAYVIDYKIREDGLLVTVKIESRPSYNRTPQIAAVPIEKP